MVKFRVRAVAEDLSLSFDGSKVGVEIDSLEISSLFRTFRITIGSKKPFMKRGVRENPTYIQNTRHCPGASSNQVCIALHHSKEPRLGAVGVLGSNRKSGCPT